MYVISYDISSDKIRKKIADELLNYGKRVQYSVFECNISQNQYKKLYTSMELLMLGQPEGNIRIYVLCQNCVEKINTIGIREDILTPEEESIFII